jgi:preprotein translocase subunit SecG
MLYAIIVLAILVCFLLVVIILIQNPKGGGLSSGFAGSNNVMGVQRTGDFLEKGTWVLAVTLMVLALMTNVVVPRGGVVNQEKNDIQKQINQPTVPVAAPSNLPIAADTTKK